MCQHRRKIGVPYGPNVCLAYEPNNWLPTVAVRFSDHYDRYDTICRWYQLHSRGMAVWR